MSPLLLIAEGDAELRTACQQFLARRRYDVETAADGLECLEKLRRLRPPVLVLDRELRWGGGDGVLAWLREPGAPAGVSVVLTATAGDPPAVLGDLRPPVVELLPKPFALTALLQSVRAVLADKRRETAFEWERTALRSEYFIG
jgi:two-component system response regulator AtoC